MVMKKTKNANHGLNARWPELEEHIHSLVFEQHAARRGLQKALSINAIYSQVRLMYFFYLHDTFFD